MKKQLIVAACATATALGCIAAAGEASAGQYSINEGRVGRVDLAPAAACHDLVKSLRITQDNPTVHAPTSGEAWVMFRPIVYLPQSGEWRLDRIDRPWSNQIRVRPGQVARWPGESTVHWENPNNQVMMAYQVLFSPGPIQVGGKPHQRPQTPKTDPDRKQRSKPDSKPDTQNKPRQRQRQHPGVVNNTLSTLNAGLTSTVQTSYTITDRMTIRMPGTSSVCTRTSSGVENLQGIGPLPYPGMPSPLFPPPSAIGPIILGDDAPAQ